MEAKEFRGRSLTYMVLEPDGYQHDLRYPMVVLLHGFGSHMRDLAGLAPAIDAGGYVYAFPNAPLPLQVGFGATGYAWTNSPGGEGDVTLDYAQEKLTKFFSDVFEQYNVAPARALLGGFSQGGMMAYRCGLPVPEAFAGVAALSSRIPEPDKLRTLLPSDRDQSVFVSHGTLDTVIPLDEGRRSRRFLEENGYQPEYREYEMGHEITQGVLADLAQWVRAVLPPLRLH